MGKRRGRRPEKALIAVQVRQIEAAGRYADGNGLYVIVDPSGARRWVLRTVVKGRRRDIGLGGVNLVSLSEAREKAGSYRKVAREGGDPVAEKHKTEVPISDLLRSRRAGPLRSIREAGATTSMRRNGSPRFAPTPFLLSALDLSVRLRLLAHFGCSVRFG